MPAVSTQFVTKMCISPPDQAQSPQNSK